MAIESGMRLVAYGMYLWKMVWPATACVLSRIRPWLSRHGSGFCPLSVLISVTPLAIRFRRKNATSPVGWFWFLGTLIPVIGLVQVGEYAMADRYAYIPLVGVFVMIAWGLADLAEAREVGTGWQVAPALCIVAALSYVTLRQIDFWESDYGLWSHTLAVAENPLTLNALGVALMHPDSEMTRHDLENLGTAQSRVDEARRHFERALELRQPQAQKNPRAYLPDMARTLNNLGNIDRLQNRIDEARQHGEGALEMYRELARQNPDVYLPYLAATLNNLGNLDRLQNRMGDARRHYEEALKINRQLAEQDPAKHLPNIAMTLNELGFLDASQNRMDEARQHYDEALKIDRELAQQSPAAYLPDLAMTLTNFGLLDASQNRMDEARRHYEEALKIDRQLAQQDSAVYSPNLAMTLSNLGRVDRLQNRADEARAHYREALSLLQELSLRDPRYDGDMARVQASLEELEKKGFQN